jgi:hypothetical protein
MKRKKQLLTAMLCVSTALGNSAAAFAQDKVKQQEAKPTAGVRINRVGQAGDAQADVFWIAEPPQGATFQVDLPAPPQSLVASAVGPQVQYVHNEFSFDSRVVKGAPYSAEAITESIQTMSDGNRIVRNSSAKIYRDNAGRTRREQAMNAVGSWAVAGEPPTMIFINDPVAGVQYNLDQNSKTAMKISVQQLSGVVSDKMGVASAVTVTGRLAEKTEGGESHFKFVTDDNRTVVFSSEAGEKAIVEMKAAEAKARGEQKAKTESGLVELKSIEAKSIAEMKARTAAIGGGAGFSIATDGAFAFSSDAEVNKESLGTQTIEGVQAEGTRVTFTIPAGKIGNERPIVSVNERWYSPELQAVVLSRNTDPRMGETTYRLVNISRAEPDPSLFQLPSDYTVKENGYNFTRPVEMMRKIDAEKRAKKPNEN